MPQKGPTGEVDGKSPSLGLGKKRLRCSMLEATRQNNWKEKSEKLAKMLVAGCVCKKEKKKCGQCSQPGGKKSSWNIVLTCRPGDAAEYRGLARGWGGPGWPNNEA